MDRRGYSLYYYRVLRLTPGRPLRRSSYLTRDTQLTRDLFYDQFNQVRIHVLVFIENVLADEMHALVGISELRGNDVGCPL